MTPRRLSVVHAAVHGAGIVAVALVLALGMAAPASAQAVPLVRASEEGIRWQDVSAAHRVVLKPLENNWSGFGASAKQKWVEVATRFPTLPADERGRIQDRMSEWAQMTPADRGRARLNFQEAKQVSPQDRKAQWEAYQALPDDQKRQLAARAAPRDAARPSGTPAIRSVTSDPAQLDSPSAKSNLVPNPAHAQPPRQVAPTVVQAQPGATTSLITKRPTPPAHQQTGLPKIAATPEFVDRATLLPQRGPQGAATRSAAASDAQATLRR